MVGNLRLFLFVICYHFIVFLNLLILLRGFGVLGPKTPKPLILLSKINNKKMIIYICATLAVVINAVTTFPNSCFEASPVFGST